MGILDFPTVRDHARVTGSDKQGSGDFQVIIIVKLVVSEAYRNRYLDEAPERSG